MSFVFAGSHDSFQFIRRVLDLLLLLVTFGYFSKPSEIQRIVAVLRNFLFSGSDCASRVDEGDIEQAVFSSDMPKATEVLGRFESVFLTLPRRRTSL
jgi:hypothetical protein